jgi:hypothetical protein
VGPRASLDDWRSENSLSYRDSNSDSSVVQAVASRNTKVKAVLRPTVSRPALVSSSYLGDATNISPSFFNYFEAPSLTRALVCSFKLLLGIASAVFVGLSPAGLMSIIFLSFRLRERERKERLGLLMRHTILGWGPRKQHLPLRRCPLVLLIVVHDQN